MRWRLSLSLFSLVRSFTLLAMPCWSIFTLTTPSVRKASTSAILAQSFRRRYTHASNMWETEDRDKMRRKDSRKRLRLMHFNQRPCRYVFPALDLPLYVQPLWKCCHTDPKHQSAALMCGIAPPTGAVSCALWLEQCSENTHTITHKKTFLLALHSSDIELHTETKRQW